MSDDSDAEAQPKRPWWVLWVAGGFVAVIVILVTAFTSRPSPPSPVAAGDAADSAPSTYTQTWPQSYSKTTCAEWGGDMTRQQQFAAAADMLASIWGKIEKVDDFPSDSLIREFQSGVTTACAVDDLSIAETAVLLYQTEPRFAP